MREGRLRADQLTFSGEHSCCVVLASGGYPGSYKTGFPIEIKGEPGAVIHCAGVREEDGRLVSAGGRVMSVTATGASLREAVDRAYEAAGQVRFDGMMKRPDIGARALEG